jgi:hypothetical protein
LTHTLHRTGNIDSLKEDYVVLAMSCRGFNDKGAAPALAKALQIMERFNPANVGDMKTGSMLTRGFNLGKILERITDTSIVQAVYTEIGSVRKALKALKEADLGMSVVVSGLYDQVARATRTVGLKPHTVNISLGVWGRTDLLPKDSEVIDTLTMCGHALISRNLVYKLAKDVKRERISPEEAGRILARCCTCGVFNPIRAAKLVESLSKRV